MSRASPPPENQLGEKRLREEKGGCSLATSWRLTRLAALAAVAGFASAGAVPLVAVLRVLLHAAALFGAPGAKRPLWANWRQRERAGQ